MTNEAEAIHTTPMRPTVIALTGLPGTGKSTLGSMLYRQLPREFSYLDIDTMTQPLVRAALAIGDLDLPGAAESGALRTLRDAQYDCLWAQVREIVAFGRSVLVVAPMTHELEDAAVFLRLVNGLRPARFVLVRTHASPEAVRRRLARRGDFLDELRLLRWQADLHRYDGRIALPLSGLELDTTEASPRSLVGHAWRWLEHELGGLVQVPAEEANLSRGTRVDA